jgi:ABC-type Co2+ transport system permease subunit
LGAVGWAAAAASLAVALVRLRRNPPNWLGLAATGALVAALRLLEFPLGQNAASGVSVLAVGLAVVVFGAEVAVCALAAATVAHGVVGPSSDWAATGANLLVHAAAVPWIIWVAYAALKKVLPSKAAGYVLAFALGAAGAPLVALVAGLVAWAGGGAAAGAAGGLLLGGLALTAAEGVLAAWGYTLALSGNYAGGGRAEVWAPRPWPGAFGLAVLALAVAAGVAPLVPVYGGALGPMPAWARAPALSYGGRALAGLATAAAAALLSAALGFVATALRPRRPT